MSQCLAQSETSTNRELQSGGRLSKKTGSGEAAGSCASPQPPAPSPAGWVEGGPSSWLPWLCLISWKHWHDSPKSQPPDYDQGKLLNDGGKFGRAELLHSRRGGFGELDPSLWDQFPNRHLSARGHLFARHLRRHSETSQMISSPSSLCWAPWAQQAFASSGWLHPLTVLSASV